MELGSPKKSTKEIASKLSKVMTFQLNRMKKPKYGEEAKDRLCSLFEELIERYMIKFNLTDVGFCRALLYAEGKTADLMVKWSCVDLTTPIAKVIMAFEGRTIYKSALEKASKEYFGVEKIGFKDVTKISKGPHPLGMKLDLPQEYSNFSSYGRKYISLAMFYCREITPYAGYISSVLRAIKIYEELSENSKLVFGMELYPDSESKNSILCSSLVSMLIKNFENYRINKKSGAILFSDPVASWSKISHFIIFRNFGFIRKRTEGYPKEIEKRLFSQFSEISKSDLVNILQVFQLSNSWTFVNSPWADSSVRGLLS